MEWLKERRKEREQSCPRKHAESTASPTRARRRRQPTAKRTWHGAACVSYCCCGQSGLPFPRKHKHTRARVHARCVSCSRWAGPARQNAAKQRHNQPVPCRRVQAAPNLIYCAQPAFTADGSFPPLAASRSRRRLTPSSQGQPGCQQRRHLVWLGCRRNPDPLSSWSARESRCRRSRSCPWCLDRG